jgi:Holliday junction resolvase
MRGARVDSNHTLIVKALRAAGWEVTSTARMGGGFPDLVCARRGIIRLVEVKTLTGKRTPDQDEFHAKFPVVLLRTIEEAVKMA